MRHRLASRAASLARALAFSPVVHACGGPFGIDHLVEYDDSGIRKRSNQVFLQNATALVVVGGALWEGDDTRLGHTYWQALDCVLVGVVTAQAMKVVFSRARGRRRPTIRISGSRATATTASRAAK